MPQNLNMLKMVNFNIYIYIESQCKNDENDRFYIYLTGIFLNCRPASPKTTL